MMWDPALNEICPAYSEIARMVKMRSRQKYQYDAANRLVQVKKRQPVTIASYPYGVRTSPEVQKREEAVAEL